MQNAKCAGVFIALSSFVLRFTIGVQQIDRAWDKLMSCYGLNQSEIVVFTIFEGFTYLRKKLWNMFYIICAWWVN